MFSWRRKSVPAASGPEPEPQTDPYPHLKEALESNPDTKWLYPRLKDIFKRHELEHHNQIVGYNSWMIAALLNAAKTRLNETERG